MDEQTEYQDALVAEFSESPPVEDTTQTHSEGDDDADITDTQEVEVAEEEVSTPDSDETPEGDDAEQKADSPEVDEPQEGEESGSETPPGEDDSTETPQFATKSDIIQALREDREAQAARHNLVSDMKKEVIERLHPQGVDKKLYDSQNREIRTAQDIVDRGLINPDTNEPFEYEEAARWMLNAQQTLNKQVADLESYAETIAETNVNLKEGHERVQELFGDYLEVMPNVAKQLSDQYFATLRKDPDSGLIVEAPLDPVEYYQTALAPYIKMAEQAVAQQAAAKEQEAKAAQRARDERTGLPQRGASKTKPNTGDPFLDALINEIEED